VNAAQLKAIKIALKVIKHLKLEVGMSELGIAEQVHFLLAKFGAKSAFPIIVGSGKNAMQPHCQPTHREIRESEPIKIDFGANVNGWRSDVTRTFVLGKVPAKLKKVIAIVKEAQKRAIAAVKPGARCCDVDHAARQYIHEQGFGRHFVHSTGHGIGLRVHQGPKIGTKNKRRLKAGMVITIEPGIYIEKWGGVRIEDMVLVTKMGHKLLTSKLK